MLLEKIQKENDIKQLKPEELEKLDRRNPSVSCGENQCHRRASGIESRCGGADDGAASGV